VTLDPERSTEEIPSASDLALSGERADALEIADSLLMIERACARLRGVIVRRYGRPANPVQSDSEHEHPA
jgi:hypothetical protein